MDAAAAPAPAPAPAASAARVAVTYNNRRPDSPRGRAPPGALRRVTAPSPGAAGGGGGGGALDLRAVLGGATLALDPEALLAGAAQALHVRDTLAPRGPAPAAPPPSAAPRPPRPAAARALAAGRGGASAWDGWLVAHALVPRKVSLSARANDVEVRLHLPQDVAGQALSLALSASLSATLHLSPPAADAHGEPPLPPGAPPPLRALHAAFPQLLAMRAAPELVARVRDLAVAWRAPEEGGRVLHTLLDAPHLVAGLGSDAAPLARLLAGAGALPPLEATAAAKAALSLRVSLADAHRIEDAAFTTAARLRPLFPDAPPAPAPAPAGALAIDVTPGGAEARALPIALRRCSVRVDAVRVLLAESRGGGGGAQRQAGPAQVRLPLADLRVDSLSATLEGLDGPGLRGRARLSVGCQYLHRACAAWEPLLERCTLGAEVSADVPLAGILRGETGTLRVRLEGVDAVNVNLSSAMVDVAASVVRVGLRGGSGSPGDPQADAQRRGEASLAWDVFNPLWVENQTGQTIVLFAPAGGRQQQVLGDALQPVTCVPVQEATHEGLPQLACKSIGLGLEFPQPSASSPTKPLRARSGEPGAAPGAEAEAEAKPLGSGAMLSRLGLVNLDAVSRQSIAVTVPSALPHGVLALHTVRVTVDVSVRDEGASKLMVVRSPLQIRNLLSVPIEVMFGDPAAPGAAVLGSRERVLIAAGGASVVPVSHIDSPDGFAVRPASPTGDVPGGARRPPQPGFRWRAGLSLRPEEWYAHAHFASFRALGKNNAPLDAVVHWDVPEPGGACTVSFRPPLTVENLLPCGMTYSLTSTADVEPPSPRKWPGQWTTQLGAGESEDTQKRNVLRGAYLWLSVKVLEFPWSSQVLLRERERGEGEDSDRIAGWLTEGRRTLRLLAPSGRTLSLEVEVRQDDCGACCVAVFAPYWLVNRTHLRAYVRQDRGGAEEEEGTGRTGGAGVAQAQSITSVEGQPLAGVRDESLPGQARAPGYAAAGHTAAADDAPPTSGVVISAARRDGPALALARVPAVRFRSPGEDASDSFGRARGAGAAEVRGLEIAAELEAEMPPDWQAESRAVEGEPGLQLFSLEEHARASGTVQMRMACTAWSEPFAVTGSSAMDTGAVEMEVVSSAVAAGRQSRGMEVGVAVTVARGAFHRTKIITLTPRYLIVNRMNRAVQVRQEGTAFALTLPAGTENKVVWHWPDARKRRNLRVLPLRAPGDEQGWHPRWSGAFTADQVRDTVVMMSSPGERALYADVCVRRVHGSIVVLLQPSQTSQPPYFLENLTPATLRVYQLGAARRLQHLRPYQGAPFAWETWLAEKPRLVVEVEGASPPISWTVDLDQVGAHRPILSARGSVLYHVAVRCDGPTLVLSIVDAVLHPHVSDAPAAPPFPALSAGGGDAPPPPARWFLEIGLSLAGAPPPLPAPALAGAAA